MLMPGDYTFVGESQGLVRSRRGLRWRIRCVTDNNVLAESEPFSGAQDKMESFEIYLSVPSENCRAQRVELSIEAFSASDTMATGQIRFDNMAIRRRESSNRS